MTTAGGPARRTRRIAAGDPRCGFACGEHALDDYFDRHALGNDKGNIGLTYVLEASAADRQVGLPPVLGYYTLSMAAVPPADAASAVESALPRYPMPVALIGRLARDSRATGRRLGETLLMDALERVLAAADIIACLGVVVDAKNQGAFGFYAKYDFVPLEDTGWPRRMFLPIETVREAFSGPGR